MFDSILVNYIDFDLGAANNFFFVDVRQAQVWSVHLKVKTVFTAGTVELLMSNDGVSGLAFSPAVEMTATGIKTGIDTGILGFAYIGVRVKTAGSSGEKADVWICGRTDNGTGVVKMTTIPIKVS